MKRITTTKRLILACVSSFLFAVGLSRAATHFDPISRNVSGAKTDVGLRQAEDCGTALSLFVDDLK